MPRSDYDRVPVTCPCGATVYAKRYQLERGWGKYCSKACAASANGGSFVRQLTSEEITDIVRQYKANVSLLAIRRDYPGLSHRRLLALLADADVPKRDHAQAAHARWTHHYAKVNGGDQEAWEKRVLEAYDAWIPLNEIERVHGATVMMLRRMLEVRNLPARTKR